MNKHYAAALLAALAMATGAQAQSPEMKARAVETYGEVMEGSTGLSRKVVTYYNAESRIIGEATYGSDADMQTYKTYEYDTDGKLLRTWSQDYQYGDGGRTEWQASKDTVTYTYDAAGNIAGTYDQLLGYSMAYEYDAEGNMTRKAQVNTDYAGEFGPKGDTYELWTETYSDFAAPNCPRKIIGDGVYNQYRFSEDVTYDDKNRVTEKKRYNVLDELTQVERWTYEGDVPTLYEKSSVKTENGEQVETPKSKIVYTVLSESPLRIEAVTSTYSTYMDEPGEWTVNPVSTVTEYFTPEAASAPELAVAMDNEKLNTAVLTFSAATITGVDNVAYDVFRHGMKIARVDGSQAVDGQLTYTDEQVANGTYDYFVQSVDASAAEVGGGMNCSDVVSVEFDTELPAPTRVRAHSVAYAGGQCTVTVVWDEPEQADGLEVQGYNIYLEGARLPLNSTPGTSTTLPTVTPITGNSYELSLGEGDAETNLSEQVYVEAIYSIGFASSDVATITNKEYDMDKLALRTTETWGDLLGETPTDRISAKIVNYYNADNQVSATVNYGANVQTRVFEPQSYEGVIFDDEKRPVKVFKQQRGLYDGLNAAWGEANDTIWYKYDAAGNLIAEQSLHSTDSTVYTYDDQGRRTGYYRYVPDAYNEYEGDWYVMESLLYSDFNEAGLPQTITGDGAYSSYMISYKVTYDEQGNVVRREKYNYQGVLSEIETYTYDMGVPSSYELDKVKNVQGEGEDMTYDLTPSKKIIYTIVGQEPLRIRTDKYDYSYGEWGGNAYFNVDEYVELQSASAPKLTVESVEGELNTISLSFDATAIDGAEATVYDIFRHGIKVARVDGGLAEGGLVTYVDRNVENGNYDYFVQAVDPAAATDGQDAMNSYGYGMNVSNSVRVTLNTELPAPTNVRVTSYEYEGGVCYANITWDEPADKDTYMLQSYNVFEEGAKAPLNTKAEGMNTVEDPILTNSYRLSLGEGNEVSNLSVTFYVQAVYTIGKANGEMVTITNHEDITDGIDAASAGNCISISGATLTATEGATFDVYTIGGTAVAKGCKGSLTLDGKAGVYVVKVDNGGQVTTHKVVVRPGE